MASESEIFKPRNDNREYRHIILSNDLQVLLIRDPDTAKSAVSMNVSVGSSSDPDELEGLAHCLEHMLFFASKKYPKEGLYSKYIIEHGGSTNAFTSEENTNFYFDINSDFLKDGLDRFAQFFIAPLFSEGDTSREIRAVDSEHQKNLLSDFWRMSQLQKHLSSRNHPYHKFGTGNLYTLEDKPRRNDINTSLELHKFHEEKYSANIMHLVVYAKEELGEIETLVEEKFQGIKNIRLNDLHFPGVPCSPEDLQILVRAVPIKDGHTLRIIWPVTPGIRHYKEGPSSYLGHLIGHEGEGSLFYTLKKKGWALKLYAGDMDLSFDYSFFYVIIELTDAGHGHHEDIIGLLFKYIHFLQIPGVAKWIFDELAAIYEMEFHYQDKVSPINYVMNIASKMRFYPPADWLVQSSLPSNFVPGTIQTMLDELSQNSVRIFWESKSFEGCTYSVEPWYRTKYAVQKLSSSIIQQWMEKAPKEDFHLPIPNIFIATVLKINPVSNTVLYPYLIRESPFSRLWYKPNTLFFTPKAYVNIDFNSPASKKSPKEAVLIDMFTRLLMDYLNEYACYARVAGLYCTIQSSDCGFQVTLRGYNQHMRSLLGAVIDKIKNFRVNKDRFSVIKEALKKDYYNMRFQQSYEQAIFYCSVILKDGALSWNEKIAFLPFLKVEDLERFSRRIVSYTGLECLIVGNIEQVNAEAMVEHIEAVLFQGISSAMKPSSLLLESLSRIVSLENGIKFCFSIDCGNPSEENSALLYYIQVHHNDIGLNAMVELFVRIAQQPTFHQLRSVEQLGYIVAVTQRDDLGIGGLQFIIQSTVKDPAQLDARLEDFLKMFESELKKMTGSDLKSNVDAVTKTMNEKHQNGREEFSFYCREIAAGTLNFDRRETVVNALGRTDKDSLINFFNRFVKVDSQERKVLSLQIYGASHSAEYKLATTTTKSDQSETTRIKNISRFQCDRVLYPILKKWS